jgi:hypothetical protein
MRKQLAILMTTLVAAMLSVPATYAFLRAYEVLFKSEPNPARIVWSAHIAMFWRLGVGVYVAGMVSIFAYMAASRDLARTTRGLYIGVFVAGAMIGVQGLFMP